MPHFNDPSTNIINSQNYSDQGKSQLDQDDDSFVLNNFQPYSGEEEMIAWLNNTEQKSDHYRSSNEP